MKSSIEMSSRVEDQTESAEFVLRLGNALLEAGYPIN
jgi:hypothetical protein